MYKAYGIIILLWPLYQFTGSGWGLWFSSRKCRLFKWGAQENLAKPTRYDYIRTCGLWWEKTTYVIDSLHMLYTCFTYVFHMLHMHYTHIQIYVYMSSCWTNKTRGLTRTMGIWAAKRWGFNQQQRDGLWESIVLRSSRNVDLSKKQPTKTQVQVQVT